MPICHPESYEQYEVTVVEAHEGGHRAFVETEVGKLSPLCKVVHHHGIEVL